MPMGKASFAHSLLFILNLDAQIILGILPGIRKPPDIIKAISKNSICLFVMLGTISAAANVALSKIAEMEFAQ